MARRENINTMDRGFYIGIITALHIMDMHGSEVQFDELVNMCNLDHLILVAIEQGELEFSGLIKRKYAQQGIKRIQSKYKHLKKGVYHIEWVDDDHICLTPKSL